ncbi:MAG: LacI family DNA-binding transcriptional regulator [Deferribacteres bacterium]|nr:LacI family DNA-binding transcriptional regulator [candidate division KSB1 bacterium]MCB9501323.1 LacI family DNA-binding transcriptional regulator [Deferribacteres bacterium]
MAVTIYDVAKLAKVGIGTVSRAINNSSHIRPQTKKVVMEAIQELGYTPHAIAQGLARKKTGILAAIMPFYTGHFYHELLRGIMKSLSTFEYDLILYYVDRVEMKNNFLDRTLHERRCDGVLTFSMEISDEYAEKYINAKVPIVVVDRAHDKIDCIQVKNDEGAYSATKHLIEMGHSRIVMITGHNNSAPARDRYQGFARAMRDAGLLIDADSIISADGLDDPTILKQNDGFNERAGEMAMKKLLQRNKAEVTAIFAASDILAIGAMKAIREAGLSVPNDYSIIGFDDIELASYLSLTTMKQPMYEIGRMAVERIMEKLENKESPARQVQLSPAIVVRKTTAKLV